jgi:hypothetical protein
MTRALLPCLALLTLAACAHNEPAPATPPAEAPPAAEAPAPPAEPAAEPKRRRPYEIYSACTDVVTIAFGEDPKASTAGRRTLAPGSSIEGARDADGNQTVWLLDASGEPLVKVNVTRGMKRVEIGKSCRTLDAR